MFKPKGPYCQKLRNATIQRSKMVEEPNLTEPAHRNFAVTATTANSHCRI